MQAAEVKRESVAATEGGQGCRFAVLVGASDEWRRGQEPPRASSGVTQGQAGSV